MSTYYPAYGNPTCNCQPPVPTSDRLRAAMARFRWLAKGEGESLNAFRRCWGEAAMLSARDRENEKLDVPQAHCHVPIVLPSGSFTAKRLPPFFVASRIGFMRTVTLSPALRVLAFHP